ncbi:MAG TPA: SIS domain-containing protein [archaeon]|nr:SIS domain-containing protein [archaeon]
MRIFMMDYIKQKFADNRAAIDSIDLEIVEKVARKISEALKNGNRVFFFGNGGSAADSAHIAGEFLGKYDFVRKALPVQALTTDIATITAVANDFGYEKVFERQVEALAKGGDILVGLSTSGTSKNVFLALQKGKEIGTFNIGFFGSSASSSKEGHAAKICDLNLFVESPFVPRIQEGHKLVGHTLAGLVEKEMMEFWGSKK